MVGGMASRLGMKLGKRLSRLLLSGMAALLLAGCAGIVRLDPPPAATTPILPVLGLPNARFWPDGPPGAILREVEQALARQRVAGLADRDAHFLAISGGGDNGAFGAGLLNGWTEAGNRPVFDVVTGISAGALIAPFAFLGPEYDPQLREVFTAVAPGELIRMRRIAIALLFNLALADTSPLYQLIVRHADEQLLAAIAREYARGRLLLIGTTNLDLQRPVIWNIGAIAASGHPEALDLFRKILLASASIPGAFPPVLMDVEAGGRSYQEMHVDGGAATQVFFYPPSLELNPTGAPRSTRQRTVHVLRNGRIEVGEVAPAQGLFSIATRSAQTLLHFSGIADIHRIQLLARRDGIGFRLAYISPDFQAERRQPFDPAYMQALFEYGRLTALSNRWAQTLPVIGDADALALGPASPRNQVATGSRTSARQGPDHR
jgi:hypothetical protein